MRKAKSLKNVSFRKYGSVILGDIEIPIKTLSIAEEIKAQISFPNEIPRKLEKPTESLKEKLIKSDPKFDDKMYPMIRVYDISDTKYIETADKINRYKKSLEAIKYIDFDAVIDEEGTTLWKDLEVEQNDWFAICEKFESMGFGATEFEKIINKAKALSGETMFEKLDKISQVTNLDMFNLIMKLEMLGIQEEKKKEEENKKTEIEEKETTIDFSKLENKIEIKNEE